MAHPTSYVLRTYLTCLTNLLLTTCSSESSWPTSSVLSTEPLRPHLARVGVGVGVGFRVRVRAGVRVRVRAGVRVGVKVGVRVRVRARARARVRVIGLGGRTA